jgi:DNA-binding transcriptional LysR family regulator
VERWHGIELRHLLALDAVAREGSFHGASARLGYVPSAVSQQIADVNATVQALVAAGIGAAIVPALAVDRRDRRTATLDLTRRVPPRTLALAWHRDRQRSPAALAFADAAVAVCAGLAAPEPTTRAV